MLIANASNTQIGGSLAGTNNVIRYNTADGIALIGLTSQGNQIEKNEIASNQGLGIDLGNDGVTANDAGDGDSGANDLLNFPVIYTATISGGNVTITGETRPGATVEIFEAAPDPNGYGEGQIFIGSAQEGSAADSASGAGVVDPTANQFSFTFPVGTLIIGDEVTASATDASGNTSEFALNIIITP